MSENMDRRVEEVELRRVATDYITDYGAAAPAHLRAEGVRARRNGDEISGEAWDDIADAAELLLARVRH
jgi:hypothetical protein